MLPELQESHDRAVDYHNAVLEVKDYMKYDDYTDPARSAYFMLMGVVWTASKRRERLSDEDATIFLNLEDQAISGLEDLPLLPVMDQIPLVEFLDYLDKTYFK